MEPIIYHHAGKYDCSKCLWEGTCLPDALHHASEQHGMRDWIVAEDGIYSLDEMRELGYA